jgi:hypothetical protein
MRAPIRFTYGNCVFADGLSDAWAAFRVEPSSYQWLGEDDKRMRFLALLGALEAIEADVQILRLAQEPPSDRYSAQLEEEVGAHGRGEPHASLRRGYLREHIRRLAELGSTSPAVFVLVSLREPERDVASFLSRAVERKPGDWRGTLAEAFALGGAGFLKARDLERVRLRADQAHARIAEFLPARPARGIELQWLVRRAFCRGLGEPFVDGLHEPRALVFERNGEAVLAPLEGDVLRWGSLVPFFWFLLLALECGFGRSWGVVTSASRCRLASYLQAKNTERSCVRCPLPCRAPGISSARLVLTYSRRSITGGRTGDWLAA